MKQFLLPGFPDGEARVEVQGRDFHYLARVRRVRTGDSLVCRLPDGSLITMAVGSIGTDRLCLRELDPVRTPNPGTGEVPLETDGNLLGIHLVQGIPKGPKFDAVVRMAQELGVVSITPCIMDHGDVRTLVTDGERVQRWNRIAREACQQSGSRGLLTIREPVTLDNIVGSGWIGPDTLGIFFHEVKLGGPSIHGVLGTRPREVIAVIGPEGGLSPRETTMLREGGWHAGWLGPGILRTETAAVAALGALRLIALEGDSWVSKTPG